MGNKISRLKRLEEALERKQRQKDLEADQALHKQQLQKHLANHPHERKPITRRTLLEAGVYSTVGYMLGPSIATILGTLSEEAYAQVMGECPTPPPAGVGPAPFINLHLSGGYQPLSAVTPRMTNGNRLDSYTRLGLGTAPAFVNNVFANRAELFDNGANQGFLRGLLASAQATTLSNAALVTVPVRDNGDSDQRSSILGLISRAGRAGAKLNYLRQGGEADTGISGLPTFGITTSVRPLQVNNINSVLNAIQPTGALARLTTAQQLRLGRAIQSLNAAQAASITGLNGGPQMAKLAQCATDQNIKNLEGGGAAINPRDIAGMAAIWNNFAQTNGVVTGNFNNDAISAMVVNVLNGNAAGAAINVGGYDIHGGGNNSRQDQETGAFNIGLCVGRMLESARLLNSKVFIQITTNGAVVCDGGQPNSSFNNDDNSGNCHGAHHFIAYSPAAPVATVSALPAQIGGLNARGNVDNGNGNFTTNMDDGGAAVFYNYCMLSGGGEALFDRTMAGLKTYTAAQKAFMRKIA